MLKQKINKPKIFFAWLFIFAFFFFSQARADEVNGENEEDEKSLDLYAENTVWHKNDDLNIKKTVYVNPGATLTIEKGAQVNLGEIEEDWIASIEVLGGRIVAEGTEAEPITIGTVSQSGGYLINFRQENWEGIPPVKPSFLRYVEIAGGGNGWNSGCPDCVAHWYNFIPSAYAYDDGEPALLFKSGKVHMENCTFRNNRYADVAVNYWEEEYNEDSYLEIVNSNFEKNEDSLAVKSEIHCETGGLSCVDTCLLKNNWYDGALGPVQDIPGNEGNGKEISGAFQFEGSRANSLIADPVVIIPGIMGSTEVAGQLKLDPILHTYDDLVKSLETNGYKKNLNLFEFPYDWRKENTDSAVQLQTKVANIMNLTKISQVDLVAHSMGGLVARAYIENEGYENIDQLITLGTPHHGSPETYLKWEAGEGFFSRKDKIMKHHFEMEALHNGNHYTNLYDYIREEVPSIKELLPDYSYLFDVAQNALRGYSDNYPRNIFLENLNDGPNLEKLKNVNFTNIIGIVGNDQSTISRMNVINSSIDWKWDNGMPENFYNKNTDQGLKYDKGDETVPERSAEDILANKTLRTNSTHNDLPTVAQCAIFEELTGRSGCTSVVETHIPNILLINVFSPIDIQIIAPDGKKMGKNFLTGGTFEQIPGAFYSGYDTQNEFITIPNPGNGEYQILTQGTGMGEYKIEATKIFEVDDEQAQTLESTVEISGTATVDKQEALAVTVSETAVEDASRDNLPPTITGAVTSEPNANGWYRQNVLIHFEATDASGIAELTPDVLLTEEGENQSVAGVAKDTLGNTASVTIAGINIDKTAPVTSAEIVGVEGQNNYYTSAVEIKFSAEDNLSQIEQTFFSLDGAPDQSGVSLMLEAGGEHLVKYYSEDRAGNREAEKTLQIKIDNTAPVATIVAPRNKTYRNNQSLAIKYVATDEISAKEKIKTELFLDGKSISANKLDLALEHLGAHTLSLLAQDEAGNKSTEAKVSFESKTDIGAMLSNIDHYFNLKLITARATKYQLELKLKIVQEKMKLLEIFQSKWMPKFVKERVVENLKKEINREIDRLISDIQDRKRLGRTIDQKVRELLAEGLKMLKL
jgi:pimeloyl-ACP methyl ester carboxylesterase